MEVEDELLALTALVLRRRRRQLRRWWVRDIFVNRERQGHYSNLIAEMRMNDLESYFNFFRMTPAKFDMLLHMVSPYIQRENTFFRRAISADERLALTLRFLASGDSMRSLSFAFCLGKSTVSVIINDVCNALWKVLMPRYLTPTNREKWAAIARDFHTMWNFPNCVGAIDGKHIVLQAPPGTGSIFFNYKNTFSLVLLAACNARYMFTIVDVGGAGRQSDGGIFSNSCFGKHLQNQTLGIPEDSPVPVGSTNMLPHVFVADEAFPLRENLMRPYPKRSLSLERRIYNYRLSRARRIIENAFGIMVSRFRIFRRPINTKLETAESITKAAVCLHNFLKSEEETERPSERRYCPVGYTDSENEGVVLPGQWRNSSSTGAVPLTRTGSNTYGRRPAAIREKFTAHFNTNGCVSWQIAAVTALD